MLRIVLYLFLLGQLDHYQIPKNDYFRRKNNNLKKNLTS
jgi:hypothetical protein